MKIMFKKLLCVMLSILTVISMIPVGFAADNPLKGDADLDAIKKELVFVEQYKDDFNMESVDFETLATGCPIHAYEYNDTGLEEITVYYPLYSSGRLVAFAIKTGENGYQISNSLVNEVVDLNIQRAAFIYDRKTCYIYDGLELIPLASYEIAFEKRALISESKDLTCLNDLQVVTLVPAQPLHYTTPDQTFSSAQRYYGLDVGHVTQGIMLIFAGLHMLPWL